MYNTLLSFFFCLISSGVYCMDEYNEYDNDDGEIVDDCRPTSCFISSALRSVICKKDSKDFFGFHSVSYNKTTTDNFERNLAMKKWSSQISLQHELHPSIFVNSSLTSSWAASLASKSVRASGETFILSWRKNKLSKPAFLIFFLPNEKCVVKAGWCFTEVHKGLGLLVTISGRICIHFTSPRNVSLDVN